MSIQQDNFKLIADAIRTKKGTTDLIRPIDFAMEIANLPSGGGTKPLGNVPKVRYIDWDGTVLMEVETKNFVAPPNNPTKLGSIFQGWNNNFIPSELDTSMSYDSEAMYITDDGKTRVKYEINPANGNTMGVRVICSDASTTIRIEWGDGTFQNHTGMSATVYTKSELANGRYVMTIERISGSGTYQIVGVDVSTTGFGTMLHSRKVLSVEFGANVIIVGNYACYACFSATSLVIPQGVKSIGDYAFYDWRSATSLVIPQGVTSISANAFANWNSATEFVFERTTPPTIQTSSFTGISLTCKFYVPDASLNAYKTETNWNTLSNQIYPISQYPKTSW